MTFIRYESRFKAGEILSDFISKEDESFHQLIKENPNEFFCFAIPNGGVPITEGFCNSLNLKYDLIIVRKIKVPFNKEAGFGSVTTDGTILINKSLLSRLNLTEKDVNDSIDITKREIKERLEFYNKPSDIGNIYKKNIQDKYIFMMDDGLASGFTMLAAIQMVRKYKPKKIIITVPTAPLHTIERIEKDIEVIFCPNIRDVWRFAVADAYKNWYDVPESEVVEILKKSKFYIK